MRRGALWLPLLLSGTVVAGACTDTPSAPVGRETIRTPLPASRITVPARPVCSGKRSGGSAFGIGGPSFDYTIGTVDPLTVDPTVDPDYEPFDPSEVPLAEYSAYYDPVSGEPCWDPYMRCINACKQLRKRSDRTICYAACMDWYSGCLAGKWLPPSLRPCGSVTQVTYDPEAEQCDGGGGGGELGTVGGEICQDEYVIVEISYDGGATWLTLWEGVTSVCS